MAEMPPRPASSYTDILEGGGTSAQAHSGSQQNKTVQGWPWKDRIWVREQARRVNKVLGQGARPMKLPQPVACSAFLPQNLK